MEIHPWSKDLWQRLRDMRNRMPHAILLHGRQGIGKLVFAQTLARAMLCEAPDANGFACGSCASCGWLAQGNHPDFRMIEPEDKVDAEGDDAAEAASSKGKRRSRYIVIDQIRGLQELVGLSAHRHGLRVVVVHPAETLNPNAANALLKMLEEPPPSTLFLLVTHHLPRLLPTIRSRCHKVAMRMPSRAEAEAWLATQGMGDPAFSLSQAGGAPLLALETDNAASRAAVEDFATQLGQGGRLDPFASAAHWDKGDFGSAVAALQKWTHDLMSVKLAGRPRYYPARQSSLQAIGKSVDLGLLLDYQRKLDAARAQAAHPLNAELQLEALLVRYAQLFPDSAKT